MEKISPLLKPWIMLGKSSLLLGNLRQYIFWSRFLKALAQKSNIKEVN